MNIADCERYLKKRLTPKRFQHSLGVMETMEELAPIYNVNKQQALLAGLLHDAAKELPEDEWMGLAGESKQVLLDSREYDYLHYLHGPVGAILIRRDLDIEDKEVLGAITTHGYYGPWELFHRPLSWCLRFADILEPGRNWQNNRWLKDLVAPLRQTVYDGHMMDAAFMICQCLDQWYRHDGVAVHPNIRQVVNGVSVENQLK